MVRTPLFHNACMGKTLIRRKSFVNNNYVFSPGSCGQPESSADRLLQCCETVKVLVTHILDAYNHATDGDCNNKGMNYLLVSGWSKDGSESMSGVFKSEKWLFLMSMLSSDILCCVGPRFRIGISICFLPCKANLVIYHQWNF